MKIFIVIIFMKSGYGGHATTAEFTSLEKCEAAKVAITESFSGFAAGMKGWCFEK